MIKKVVLLSLCLSSDALHASIFDTVWNGVKDAANTVGNEVKKLGNCFGDTKVTRAVDYAARKAALEAALPIAQGVLTAAEAVSHGSLDAAEASAKLAVSAAQEFLKGVEGVSVTTMQGSALASQGILEGVKQGTVGVLKGTRFVVGGVLDQFDINEIAFKGDLQRLAGGVLGDVRVKGKFFVDFNEELTLDPKNIPASIGRLIEKLVSKLGDAVFAPIMTEIKKVDTKLHDPAVVKGLSIIGSQEPAAVAAAIAAQQGIDAQLATLQAKQEAMKKVLLNAQADMEKLRAMSGEQLLELVKKAAPTGGSYSAFELRARQELARRAKAARRG